MLLIRRFEERTAEMYALGKIGGFCHLYIGEEAVAVGAVDALRPDDYVFSAYRDHGHCLARGSDPKRVMAELFGRSTGLCKGKGGSMHLVDVERRFMGGYAVGKALEQVRTRQRPYFLEAVTYRFLGHSMADPAHGHYRTKAEVDEAKKRDPLLLLRTRMLGERLATEADFKRIEQEVAEIVREAVEFADASPAPPLTALEDDVYV